MSARREFPKRIKLQILKRAMNARGQVSCEGCGLVLKPGQFEFDHTLPEALVMDKSRELTAADGKLLGKLCCHRPKSAGDLRRIRKSDRQRVRHYGLTKAAKPMPGSRKSAWRHRMDGTWERRND